MSAALIARLIEAGTPAALVAEVAMELGRAEGERTALAKRRASDRDRKARSRDITGQDVTSAESADNTAPLSSPLPSPPDPLNLPPYNPPTDDGLACARASAFPKPEGVDAQHWRDFLANRKRKSLPNTATAHKRLVADLTRLADDDWPPGRLIEHAASKGWAAIYDPRKDERNGQRPDHHRAGRYAERMRDPVLDDLAQGTRAGSG